jgi:hypothetical protein
VVDPDLTRTYDWFEHHSGWAPPDPDTLDEWLADGVCRCPDDCLVDDPDATCAHGLVTWARIDHELRTFDAGSRRERGS